MSTIAQTNNQPTTVVMSPDDREIQEVNVDSLQINASNLEINSVDLSDLSNEISVISEAVDVVKMVGMAVQAITVPILVFSTGLLAASALSFAIQMKGCLKGVLVLEKSCPV